MLEDLSKIVLKKIIRQYNIHTGIRGYSKLSKEDLIKHIHSKMTYENGELVIKPNNDQIEIPQPKLRTVKQPKKVIVPVDKFKEYDVDKLNIYKVQDYIKTYTEKLNDYRKNKSNKNKMASDFEKLTHENKVNEAIKFMAIVPSNKIPFYINVFLNSLPEKEADLIVLSGNATKKYIYHRHELLKRYFTNEELKSELIDLELLNLVDKNNHTYYREILRAIDHLDQYKYKNLDGIMHVTTKKS
jgi:hypothetical protein